MKGNILVSVDIIGTPGPAASASLETVASEARCGPAVLIITNSSDDSAPAGGPLLGVSRRVPLT